VVGSGAGRRCCWPLNAGPLGAVVLRKFVTPVSIGFLAVATSCGPTLEVTPSDVVAQINSSLVPGDGSEEIEAYFESRELDASFDRSSQRYQGIITHPDSNYHAIVIHIYVDERRRFVRAEARHSYTAP